MIPVAYGDGVADRIRAAAPGGVDVANVYPLAQVREAYTELERRHTRGKIVLRPRRLTPRGSGAS